jgi:purine-cytosine permease-like protein
MEEKKTSLVENITLTSVPADQRKPWPSIAFIWAGSVICIPALMVGSLISLGMNFKQSALCMVIGYVLVVFYMCLMGIQSSDLGLPAMGIIVAMVVYCLGTLLIKNEKINPIYAMKMKHVSLKNK